MDTNIAKFSVVEFDSMRLCQHMMYFSYCVTNCSHAEHTQEIGIWHSTIAVHICTQRHTRTHIYIWATEKTNANTELHMQTCNQKFCKYFGWAVLCYVRFLFWQKKQREFLSLKSISLLHVHLCICGPFLSRSHVHLCLIVTKTISKHSAIFRENSNGFSWMSCLWHIFYGDTVTRWCKCTCTFLSLKMQNISYHFAIIHAVDFQRPDIVWLLISVRNAKTFSAQEQPIRIDFVLFHSFSQQKFSVCVRFAFEIHKKRSLSVIKLYRKCPKHQMAIRRSSFVFRFQLKLLIPIYILHLQINGLRHAQKPTSTSFVNGKSRLNDAHNNISIYGKSRPIKLNKVECVPVVYMHARSMLHEFICGKSIEEHWCSVFLSNRLWKE